MKKAIYIKNMFYNTIYRTDDNRYKDAIIAFTTIRYDDKAREEFCTLNKIEDNKCNEVWKEVLAKRISNYDDFINDNIKWVAQGIYRTEEDKVKYFEPESIDPKFVLNDITDIEIMMVGQEIDNLVFVKLYDHNGESIPPITCSIDNCEEVLKRLVSNYDKLYNTGKIIVLESRNENEKEQEDFIDTMTFIIKETEVEAIGAKHADKYSDSSLVRLPLEAGLSIVEKNKNINVKYKKIVDGKDVNISREEFKDIINKINIKTVCETTPVTKLEEEQFYDDYSNEHPWIVEKKNSKKVKIFAGALALIGIGACILWPNSSKTSKNNTNTIKTSVTSNPDETTAAKEIATENTTITSKNNTNVSTITSQNIDKQYTAITTYENTTAKESTISNSESTNNNISNKSTTNNGYNITTKPTTRYTGTYRTINSRDMIPSQTGTNRATTKSTTKSTVPSGTVNPRDMVTAPSKAGDQIFTNNGATTTTKSSATTKKTTNNPYADLIITKEIDNSGKSLVLKR